MKNIIIAILVIAFATFNTAGFVDFNVYHDLGAKALPCFGSWQKVSMNESHRGRQPAQLRNHLLNGQT